MRTSNYNIEDMLFDDEIDMVTLPKKEHWSGAQIYHFIDDIQKQYELTSQLDLPMEASAHYRDLLTRLIKTYGH
ncbi:MAG TPA: hypothetical protein DCS66_22455 [Flavobacteriaceae bacterium]|nr:hypothetical protein [Flavobacteriaceae bacterium]|tara:strand:- start:600 stop:821 length:222 start_codon:yes stop_codon:yes gene_type:complete